MVYMLLQVPTLNFSTFFYIYLPNYPDWLNCLLFLFKNCITGKDCDRIFRFYPRSRQIISASISSRNLQDDLPIIVQWFQLDHHSYDVPHGAVESRLDHVRFDITSNRGVVSYRGIASGNSLNLQAHSHINDKRSQLNCVFIKSSMEVNL
jgi:hypothetical protein